MAKRIFVSYNFNDREVTKTVKSMTQNVGGCVQGQFVFVENNVSRDGRSAIDAEIKKIMNDCDAALFVIGNNSHNSPWINREVELAISYGIKIVKTQLPSTNGGQPEKLNWLNCREAQWSARSIADCLNNL